jgi:hypothetical protein
MSHNKPNPTFAPTTVVAISSPLPTIELARMMPGPRAAIVFQKVFGGGEYSVLSSVTSMPSASLTRDLFSTYIPKNKATPYEYLKHMAYPLDPVII